MFYIYFIQNVKQKVYYFYNKNEEYAYMYVVYKGLYIKCI